MAETTRLHGYHCPKEIKAAIQADAERFERSESAQTVRVVETWYALPEWVRTHISQQALLQGRTEGELMAEQITNCLQKQGIKPPETEAEVKAKQLVENPAQLSEVLRLVIGMLERNAKRFICVFA